MAKTVRDATLDSRTAREKLKARAKPYFRSLDRGLHLGYRKGKRGGTWVVRRYLGEEQYVIEAVGAADDKQDADGLHVLSFFQAQTAARNRAVTAAEEQKLAAAGPAITVEHAVNEYMAVRDARTASQKGVAAAHSDARGRLAKHVLSDADMAARPLAQLTADHLSVWRSSIGTNMSPSSVTRTTSDFKAALNAAAMRYRSRLPASLPMAIKDGLRSTEAVAPVAREAQVLTDADIRAIISGAGLVDEEGGWGGALQRLVVVLAATGARFSQIRRQTVADVQAAQNRLMVPVSNKGRGVKATSRIGVRVGKDVLESDSKLCFAIS